MDTQVSEGSTSTNGATGRTPRDYARRLLEMARQHPDDETLLPEFEAVVADAMRSGIAVFGRRKPFESGAPRKTPTKPVVSEERLRQVLKHMPVLMVAFDEGGNISMWNRACEKMTGYTADELGSAAAALEKLFPDPDYRSNTGTRWLKRRDRFHHMETSMVGKDGREHTIAWSNLTDEIPITGWSAWYIGVEVTRLREAERAQEEQLRFVQTVLNSIPLPVFIKDQAGRVIGCNPSAEELMLMPKAQLLKKTLDELIDDANASPKIRAQSAQVIEDGLPSEIEVEPVLPDGSRHLLMIQEVAISAADGRGIGLLSIVVDMTDRQAHERRRQRLNERIQRAQKLESLGVVVGGVAHDFNNMLMAILGNVELAMMDSDPESELYESLEQIRLSARHGAELVSEMLNYAGRRKLAVESVDLNGLVREMVDMGRSVVSKKATLNIEPAAESFAFEGDAGQMRQVIMNLLTNASDALNDKPGTITVRTGTMKATEDDLARNLSGKSLRPGTYAWFEVEDTGEGVPEDVQAQIFDPFFSTKFAGRGLGLASVLGIVRSHDGGLLLETAPGKGSRFRVLIPHSSTAGKETSRFKPLPAVDAGATRTVMVVDDELPVLRAAKAMLERLGYQVVMANGGREAICTYRERMSEIDLVLMDMAMPELSGVEVYHELQNLNPNVHVVFSSGYREEEALTDMSQHALFLHKPYDLKRIDAVMKEAFPSLPEAKPVDPSIDES